jgi:hypothetical protein
MTTTPSGLEGRYAALSFHRYRAACRRLHTQRLAAPWYISQGNIIGVDFRRDDERNAPLRVYRRQIRRYAEWYLATKCRIDVGDFPGWVVSDHDSTAAPSVFLGKGHQPVPLPAHTARLFTQEDVT